jgi:hypothetical protein
LRNRKSALPNFLFLSLNPYLRFTRKDVLITVSFLEVFSFHPLPYPPSPFPLPLKTANCQGFRFCPKGQLTKTDNRPKNRPFPPQSRAVSRVEFSILLRRPTNPPKLWSKVGSLGFLPDDHRRPSKSDKILGF